jgi:hypothetical protein
MKRKSRPLAWLTAIVLVLLTAYILAYLGLSRRGYAEADRLNLVAFTYVSPDDTDAWRSCHDVCTIFFFPLNQIDQWLGSGQCPYDDGETYSIVISN